MSRVNVDDLAQEIRRVDGNHDMGAGELAEALIPFLSAAIEGEAVPVAGRGEQRTTCEACGNSNLPHDRAVWADDGSSFCPGCSPSSNADRLEGVTPTRYFIEHDGFVGTVIGRYTRLDGKTGVVLQQDGTNVVHVYGSKWLKPAGPPLISPDTHEDDKRDELIERLKREAQQHAGEARGANATIYEIYQVLSGATGEPGNWHGAEPAREYVAQDDKRVGEARNEALRDALAAAADHTPEKREVTLAAHVTGKNIQAAILALVKPQGDGK